MRKETEGRRGSVEETGGGEKGTGQGKDINHRVQ